MLSRELGTKLTGRHISKELFHDILYRDMMVRHGIRDVRSLKNLTVYLVSNAGNLLTANKLQHPLGIKSTATVLDYFSFLEDTYLIHFMPKFSYSLKVQMVNPRKIYVIDPGIIAIASTSFTENKGHLLENLIYWELRRQGKNLYYFNENKAECDFVIMKNEKLEQVIQVCYELLPENREREIRGLTKAMDFFKTDNGLIISFNQQDAFMYNGKRIEVVPAWKFLGRF